MPDGDGHLQLPDRPGARTAAAVPPPPSQPPQVPGGRARGLLSLRRSRTAPQQPAPEAAAQHAAARARQAAAQRERWPDPAALLLTALGPGPRLWERTPTHPDALAVRLGTADRPGGPGTAPGTLLPAVPVTADLQTAGSLGLAGPRPRLTGLARAVLAQLAVLHPPSGLALVVVAADEQRAADWDWTMWLPHLRPGQGQDCSCWSASAPSRPRPGSPSWPPPRAARRPPSCSSTATRAPRRPARASTCCSARAPPSASSRSASRSPRRSCPPGSAPAPR
ncbi:hypothetical protein ACFQ1I_18105 [Kitasatospora arboriphila]